MNPTDTTPLTIRRWAAPGQPLSERPVFVMDAEDLPQDLSRIAIVLPQADATRAKELLKSGAGQVLLGDAALLDSNLLKQLSDEFGSHRVGAWLPTRRMEVSWSLDLDCNADFRCLTPSLGAPSWEVVKSDGARTGTEVGWWAEQMVMLGASMLVVGAFDLVDDADLNICAGLVERFGSRLWLAPLGEELTDLGAAVQFGKVAQLVLPDSFDENNLKAECVTPQAEEARKSA